MKQLKLFTSTVLKESSTRRDSRHFKLVVLFLEAMAQMPCKGFL